MLKLNSTGAYNPSGRISSITGNAFTTTTTTSTTRHDPNGLNQIVVDIDYEMESSLIKEFLCKFELPVVTHEAQGEGEEKAPEADDALQPEQGIKKYMRVLSEVAALKRTLVTIDIDDLLTDEKYASLAHRIHANTYRYVQLFSKAIDQLMPETEGMGLEEMDTVNVLVSQRIARLKAKNINTHSIPAGLIRRYTLTFKPSVVKTKQLAVRQVHSEHVGKLIVLKGIITRVSEVKPLIVVATYTCDSCGSEVYQEVTSSAFMPVIECPSVDCQRNNVKGQLSMLTRGSRFVKYQEGRVQELTDQVPMGHIPRSMAVQFYGDLTRMAGPGDQVVISGIFMPRPYTGFRAIRAGLLTDTYLLVQHVELVKASMSALSLATVTPTDVFDRLLSELKQDPFSAYERLSASIAPEIFGHDDIKKAILLLMVGGVDKRMPDGMFIRGNVNICLMGDPGVAKSQLLKWVAKTAPRAVYTTGKGSSGVGLTAAVTKDPMTNEMVLEGGALVLADNGICCIDEFDKMDELDRTAIHEVMEQQTISIAKAGITTTLNARTSILAAANPLYGRYNPRKSPKENINLPPALLSRFDLLFLILDIADGSKDGMLAEHVCHVHRTGTAPVVESGHIPAEVFRCYVSEARSRDPAIPHHLADYIVKSYTDLRAGDETANDGSYTTARTLLGIIRLAQGLARVQLRPIVLQEDVDEALRLMSVSRSSIGSAYGSKPRRQPRELSVVAKLYSLIKRISLTSSETVDEGAIKIVPMYVIRAGAHSAGFTDEQLQQCLVDYDMVDAWSVSDDGTLLKIYR